MLMLLCLLTFICLLILGTSQKVKDKLKHKELKINTFAEFNAAKLY